MLSNPFLDIDLIESISEKQRFFKKIRSFDTNTIVKSKNNLVKKFKNNTDNFIQVKKDVQINCPNDIEINNKKRKRANSN